ncbi:MAG: sigma 54-interacting transcriptional regulator [Desulfobacterales bacterium]|nr:sigma 54-interacting transcriptional regulator [Desulfobacterales bacterium]MDD3081470.1 sigma 54-interacting transcriptional regulator [Desulfobacterales bacterium]MDD3950385.1 sigma 54-interacting transcriptional regulator [Desulfobacterales bacterium]MDD4463016.1 sigma 54-interacting transcriptional regulator [Desulfobacterales bacterium]
MNDQTGKHLAHISTILDSVADGVFTVDESMRITSFNRAAEEITGFSRDEALGQRCCEIFRTDVCFSACPVEEAMKTGQDVTNREVSVLDRRNREIPISVNASALRDADGRPVGGVETFRDLSQLRALTREMEEKYTFHHLVSRNPAMRKLFDILPDVAASDVAVLIQGDSGTGKELFARAIHNLSPRKDKPLVVVNCGALPEPLLEAEIFGAKRGAYTGAVDDRPGRLELAEGGTFFLDEIGDLPLSLQVKLLRVIENLEYQPLGAKRSRKADVRFVAATHRDLEQMVRVGNFRQDLFFRLNVIVLKIPPLSARSEDIPLLLDLALERFNAKYGKKIRGFTSEALSFLLNHAYPGNVRELLNMVERAVILNHDAMIGVKDFPASISRDPSPQLARPDGKRPSRKDLQRILEQYGGNRALAAQTLGVHRTTLWRWMKTTGC